ncbi:MAG: radical SAM family heme chaperone HemW [Deltaproteobacteria bacterium]|nr:radical SAM family heme chaperone HemW [Deltaproteobacteria bacterium]
MAGVLQYELVEALGRELLARALTPAPEGPAPEPESLPSLDSFAVYVHVPFCGSLCAYCSFAKGRDDELIERYFDALRWELEAYGALPQLAGARVTSIFLGGGTPSYVPAEKLADLLERLRGLFRVGPEVQVTLEANPESVDPAKLAAYRAAGIDRISLGVQSFDEARLRSLGRRHRRAEIDRAFGTIREAGISELSADLMYGLPGQTLADFDHELDQALAAPLTHLSIFPLIYRPDTPLYRRREEVQALQLELYERASARLEAAGFTAYTPEDFSRSGVYCAYQLDVWRPPARACLGLGAGALSGAAGRHWQNLGDTRAYLRACEAGAWPRRSGGTRDADDEATELLLLSAKTLRFELRLLEPHLGSARATTVKGWLGVAEQAGLVTRTSPEVFELTRPGRFFAARWWSAFILEKLGRAAQRSEKA